MLKNVLKITQKLQSIPNVPFVVKPIEQFIKTAVRSSGNKVINDNYSIIVNLVKRPRKRKLVIMCHTDHPGIIIKNQKLGITMGTIVTSRIRKILSSKAIDIKVFSPTGEYLGAGKITKLHDDNRHVSLDIGFDVKANSFAQYNVTYYEDNDKVIRAYSLDNSISVAILLGLLNKRFNSMYDLYFIFNLYEEVHQISAWHLAKENILNLKKTDLIINLECMKVENIDENTYPKSSYENGVILQLSNIGCLFGYNIPEENEAEILVKTVAAENNINLQTGIIKDSDDSRPFSFFPLTANIVTINIPNRYKHNRGKYGEIVSEEIYKTDIRDVLTLIQKIIDNKKDFAGKKSYSKQLKDKYLITDHSLMIAKARLNERLNIKYKNIIKRRYFYPLNLGDLILDTYYTTGFYIKYYLQMVGLSK